MIDRLPELKKVNHPLSIESQPLWWVHVWSRPQSIKSLLVINKLVAEIGDRWLVHREYKISPRDDCSSKKQQLPYPDNKG